MKLEKIKNAFKEILSKEKEIIATYLYGSASYSEFYEDIDIGLLIDERFKPNYMYEVKIAGKLEKRFKDTIGIYKSIDVRILNGKPLRFLFSILKNSTLIYSVDDLKRVQFEAKIMKEYLDFKPHSEFYEKMRRYRYANR
jgi:predicted nucleotidyltransferase